jgi:hypothetical protein
MFYLIWDIPITLSKASQTHHHPLDLEPGVLQAWRFRLLSLFTEEGFSCSLVAILRCCWCVHLICLSVSTFLLARPSNPLDHHNTSSNTFLNFRLLPVSRSIVVHSLHSTQQVSIKLFHSMADLQCSPCTKSTISHTSDDTLIDDSSPSFFTFISISIPHILFLPHTKSALFQTIIDAFDPLKCSCEVCYFL